MVRIPKHVYDSASLVKTNVIANHTTLPKELLNPRVCPLCRGQMEAIEATVRVGYRKCTRCSYTQPVIQLEHIRADLGVTIADVGKATLVGLGIAALAYLISRSS